jgi:DNA polymerase
LEDYEILYNLYVLKSLGYKYIDNIKKEDISSENFENFKTLNNTISSCHLCDLSKSRKQSMLGYGNTNAKVMIIDFEVSSLEDELNDYYCGKSGELLKNMIQNVLELKVENVFFTHIIKCKPLNTKNDIFKYSKLCSTYLFSQIKLINPKIIILLGQNCYNCVIGDDNFKNTRGHIINLFNKKLIPIYHPKTILKNPSLKKIVFNDLKTIKSCL